MEIQNNIYSYITYSLGFDAAEDYIVCKNDTFPTALDKINTQIIQRRDKLIFSVIEN